MHLSVSDLEVVYNGAVQALHDVSLEVADAAVVAVLGANGAGKSTLLRAVSGTLALQGGAVRRGSITLDGKSLLGRHPAAIVAAGIVQVPEGRQIFERLTVEENLRAGGFSRPGRAAGAKAQREIYDLFPILAERSSLRAGLLSGGQQQLLAIGRALMARPQLLMLDEPSLGLAPLLVGQIGRVIREINERGTAVLLIEQNAVMALGLANSACVLEVGRVCLSGTSAELRATDEVRRLYLGSDEADRATLEVPVGPVRTLTRWAG